MPQWMLRYDLRTAAGIGAPHEELYAAALEQCEWADRQGCPAILLPEHHGSVGGYLASPAVLGAGVAARTTRARIMVTDTVLRDPIARAEDFAALDQLSGGRLDGLLTVGYVPEEFAMYGEQFDSRVRAFEEKADSLMRLLAGEEVYYRGRRATISPLPSQQPRPPITFGGATPAAARRSAAMADGFMPIVPDPGLVEAYEAECARLGREPRSYRHVRGALAVLVVEDPERAWAELGKYILDDMNTYGHWKAAEPGASPYYPAEDVETVRASGLYSLVTPEECVELMNRGPDGTTIFLHPLLAGIDPDVGWQSLHLFVDEVLPRLHDDSA
ncbi:LLM class flavin-dependent oxidoreductase [Haloechinothrix sp. LS1_15]|uniref:LLM class flavin-dependent oxidoreductase n=1 Tax=Haloechinothrix sp. LS1_15 TaxID=2652248 RepID=UPI002944E067|nr:LLM class flavin-dependent oxidoreductase [Haloechinothrix sp. LS1_15]MDV6012202.1 LLM class flavin-dependent oxidoreductase [Haloechinothrix sp. LS1_15]